MRTFLSTLDDTFGSGMGWSDSPTSAGGSGRDQHRRRARGQRGARTLEHVLDEDGALSDLLVDREALVVGGGEEDHACGCGGCWAEGRKSEGVLRTLRHTATPSYEAWRTRVRRAAVVPIRPRLTSMVFAAALSSLRACLDKSRTTFSGIGMTRAAPLLVRQVVTEGLYTQVLSGQQPSAQEALSATTVAPPASASVSRSSQVLRPLPLFPGRAV
jgi:hypothetical protein